MSLKSNASPFISIDQLQQELDNPNVKIFDVRGKWNGSVSDAFNEYSQGHIKGAVFLDWMHHFLEPDISINLAPVASKENAQCSFDALGISADDPVVLYDDYNHMLAGRIWWAMRYWGFDNVKVLNGGWKKWQAEDLPLAKTEEASTAIDAPCLKAIFSVSEPKSALRVSLDEIINLKDSHCLIDARGPINYGGKPDDPRTGHIPGAINISFREVLDEATGLFKSDSALKEIFSSQINDFQNASIISSCGSGYAGTIILLALYQIGIEAPLFDDSFAVWKMDEERLVEQALLDQ